MRVRMEALQSSSFIKRDPIICCCGWAGGIHCKIVEIGRQAFDLVLHLVKRVCLVHIAMPVEDGLISLFLRPQTRERNTHTTCRQGCACWGLHEEMFKLKRYLATIKNTTKELRVKLDTSSSLLSPSKQYFGVRLIFAQDHAVSCSMLFKRI